jgi:hypothetical protein
MSVGSAMFTELSAGAPDGSVQLKVKSDKPVFPRVKATPSVTEYRLGPTSVVTAWDRVVRARKLAAMPDWMSRGCMLFLMKFTKVGEYGRMALAQVGRKFVG